MLMLNTSLMVDPSASVTRTVKEYPPAVCGVPAICPLDCKGEPGRQRP
jgi:hypothetical protein